ncbi:MAG: cache domain-containing protein [Halobacteriovoraceae bacterium]|nr:cache domain-containing protein [Halobacteriovoraceae bacterium]
MQKLHRKSITETFLIISVIMTLFVVLFIGGSNIYSVYSIYRDDTNMFEEEYLEQHKKTLKLEVEQTELNIEKELGQLEKRLKLQISSRVNEGLNVAKNLFEKYQNEMPKKDIINLIRESLRSIRFNKGRGYYFMMNTEGVEILFADKPELEGKNLIKMKSTDGIFVVKEMLKIAKNNGEGFINYEWSKPNETEKNFSKISYVKYFKELDLIIGTGEYLDDVESDLKEEILSRLERTISKNLDYFWALRSDGTLLAHPFLTELKGRKILHLVDENGVNIIKEAINVAKNGGGFVRYKWNRPIKNNTSSKLTYVYPFKRWGWIIATGAYLDDLEVWTQTRKDQLQARLIDQILITILVMGLSFVLSTIVFRRATSRINKGFKIFQNLFEHPDSKLTEGQEKEFQFKEFQILSNSSKILEKYYQQINEEKIRAENALRARTEFLNNMSHEIRTPMNVIVGMADLIDESKMNEEQKMFLGSFQDACKTLLTIINDILDLSKLEAGKLDLDFNFFDLELKLKKIVQLFKNEVEKKGLKISYNIDEGIANFIETDEIRLSQVLSNLIGNSLKFTQSGEIDINVKLVEDYSKNQRIRFEVYDTGIGISKENIKTIFDEFNQGDASITKKFGGTGLGLSISSKLVRLLGGKLKVQSEFGAYTRFYFELDLVVNKTMESPKTLEVIVNQKTPIKKYSEAHFNKLKILAVDDTKDNLVIIQKFLKHPDIELDTVMSGRDGLKAINEKEYDLIFMDIQMPEMDGYETTKKVREIERKLGRPKTLIYALTAYAMQENIQRSLAAGCDGHITKPIRKGEMQKFILELVHNKLAS